jgi:hypothetical protein
MMKQLKAVIYRLGGADHWILEECSSRTQIKYLIFAIALVFSVTLAFIGGFDVAQQYVPSVASMGTRIWIGIAAGTLWAALTFYLDFGLMNVSGGRVVSTLIRGISGIASVCITITALLILLNQSKIDNKITLESSTKIDAVDKEYLDAKKERYKLVSAKKALAEKYNEDVVLAEANRGYPGPRYNDKKAAYDVMIAAVEEERKSLEEKEGAYTTQYDNKRQALVSLESADFMTKVDKLFEVILASGYFSIFIIGCVYIFFASIELGALTLKTTISEDDEYHTKEKDYNQRHEAIRQEEALTNDRLLRDKKRHKSRRELSDFEAARYAETMQIIDDGIVREAEIRGRIQILRRKGYDTAADQLEAEWGRRNQS